MAGSPIVQIRKAVVEGLSQMENLAGVEVTYTWQQNSTAREQVFTLRARTDSNDPAALRSGRNNRNERGRFQIVVKARIPGESPETVDERALALGADVEDFLADRKSNELGVTGLNWIRQDGWTLDGGWADNTYVAELTYDVVYDARVT